MTTPNNPEAPAAKTAGQQRGRPFAKGQSGNPAGRPQGSRHAVSLAIDALLEGDAEKLTRKAIEMALSGDGTAMRLCFDRLSPPRRDRPIQFALPKLETAADAKAAAAAIVQAVRKATSRPARRLTCRSCSTTLRGSLRQLTSRPDLKRWRGKPANEPDQGTP
jgi:hypothetical protein